MVDLPNYLQICPISKIAVLFEYYGFWWKQKLAIKRIGLICFLGSHNKLMKKFYLHERSSFNRSLTTSDIIGKITSDCPQPICKFVLGFPFNFFANQSPTLSFCRSPQAYIWSRISILILRSHIKENQFYAIKPHSSAPFTRRKGELWT